MVTVFRILGVFAALLAWYWSRSAASTVNRAGRAKREMPPEPKREKNESEYRYLARCQEYGRAENALAALETLWEQRQKKADKWTSRTNWLRRQSGSGWLLFGNYLAAIGTFFALTYAVYHYPSESRIVAGAVVWVMENVARRF